MVKRAVIARQATGPAAYHAEQREKEVQTLRDQVARLQANLEEWVNPYAHNLAVEEAVTRAYTTGRADGFLDGVLAYGIKFDPRHREALAIAAKWAA